MENRQYKTGTIAGSERPMGVTRENKPRMNNYKKQSKFGKYQYRLIWTALWMIFISGLVIFFNDPIYLFGMIAWFIGFFNY